MDLLGMGARVMLRGAVAREITCQFTGAVLDARTAVLIDVWSPHGSHTTYVTTGEHFDSVRDSLLNLGSSGYEVSIIDGRELNRR